MQHGDGRGCQPKQLNALLTEVTETAFFRLINVNMDGKCQYWGGPETEEPSCDGGKNDETFAAFAEPSAPLCARSAPTHRLRPVGRATRSGQPLRWQLLLLLLLLALWHVGRSAILRPRGRHDHA